MVWRGDHAEAYNLPPLGRVVLGRGTDVDVRISAPSISRRHAELLLDKERVLLRDLGAQNGTRLNGERLVGERALTYGDVITLGDVLLTFSEQPRDESALRDSNPVPEEMERTVLIGGATVLVADPAMIQVYSQIERLASSDLSILIWGETGTGKELAATALHLWSNRAAGPFVPINCAALPEGLAESELFGHVRGAFSGAVADKPGLLESAANGTVFLDEIGDLSLAIQSKLLRVLETRSVTRLGSVAERKIDVRIVAASHRRLELGVKEGWFRQDLFYRLNVGFLTLPPLRARPRELTRLAGNFLNAAREKLGGAPISLTSSAMQRLMAHPWPGNIRELKNMMDYLAVTHGQGAIDRGDVAAVLDRSDRRDQPASIARLPSVGEVALPPSVREEPSPRSLDESKRQYERQSIEASLASTGGNKTRAAKLLGIPLRTFMAKIKRHGIR